MQRYTCVFFFLLLLCFLTTNESSKIYAAEPSLDQLYYNFFVSVVQAGKAVEELQTGPSTKSRLRERLAISADAETTLKTISRETLDRVSAQDAKAQRIIDEFHARYPPGQLGAGQELPRAPEELKQLWAERKQIVLSQVAHLQTTLSPTAYQHIQLCIMRSSSNKTLRTVPPSPEQLRLLHNARLDRETTK